jgi:hypothetical protein
LSTYVDNLSPAIHYGEAQAKRTGARNGHLWCHLMADSLEELHAFAARLGLKREWFQGDHYDLIPRRREHAVRLGALEVPARRLVEIRRKLRVPPPRLPSAPDAEGGP